MKRRDLFKIGAGASVAPAIPKKKKRRVIAASVGIAIVKDGEVIFDPPIEEQRAAAERLFKNKS